MADYDFRSLSPHDFELLCRDLLQRPLGVRLESFTAGRDSGIDFRHRTKTDTLIVQVKHYADSGYEALVRVLKRKERAKLEALKPTRYILATSVGITPQRKDELLALLSPWCVSASDILGKDDINSLLTQYEDIERQHFKLWLTSAGVLERVLHAGIFGDTEAHLDRIRLRLARYVPNPSFERAQKILEKTRFCIVAGIPGIGKTTLAEVLLADLVDRQGFAALRIAHDLSELRPVKNQKSKQVFYFDDFLGKTSLEKLQRNEDQRIIELLEEVSGNPNWRFILTTREYILNIARNRYEAFAHPSIDLPMCIINLNDYTRPVRAKILYNHIYFSDLPTDYKLALLEGRGYEKVLDHRNYNPRVIEYMTQPRHAMTVAPTLYLREFVDSLDNPSRLWDHAFRHQISEAARHLLLVLTIMPNETRLENLERAFWTFYSFRHKRFGFATAPGDWIDALKELDGNFIKTARIGGDIAVSFHNPSVKDFLEQFLASSDADVADLFTGAQFYEQYTGLWNGRRGRRYNGIDAASGDYIRTLAANLWGESATTIRQVDHYGQTVGLVPHSPSNETRTRFLISVLDGLKYPHADQLIDSVLGTLTEMWTSGKADREDLVTLLDVLRQRGLKQSDAPFSAARQCLLSEPETDEEFRAVASFCEKYPDAVSDAEREALRRCFVEFASDHPLGSADDPDLLRSVASDIEYVGERLGVATNEFTQGLYERADEIESERAGPEPPDDDEGPWRSADSHVDDVHGMFDGLRSDLKQE
ncbi:MAG: restriction endonuclease [Vicinamibacterales bacterium]